ncbi:MAG: ABC transporter permease subunit [Candidatus Eisenbacteria bacterium]|uniref:ABC transporter permease subunit n=1 Tax=Eiseniibacteriota bacterium TaxID=2212470 RepID=A0A956RP75_UNCEI|nr:ABC transporter permease subunit [Candidatus Eisenbacteria bacterium]
MNRYRRRNWTDRTARSTITGGGLIIIASILAMLVFLVSQCVPLWSSPRIHAEESFAVPGAPSTPPSMMVAGANDFREVIFAVDAAGHARAWSSEGPVLAETDLLQNERITCARPLQLDAERWVIATDSLHVYPLVFSDGQYFEEGVRKYRPEFSLGPALSWQGQPAQLIAGSQEGDDLRVALASRDNHLLVLSRHEKKSLLGGSTVQDSETTIDVPDASRVTALELDGAGKHLYAGTAEGSLLEWSLGEGDPRLVGSHQALTAAVSHLGRLLGGSSIVVGGADGSVQVWFRARVEEDQQRLVQAHSFARMDAPVVGSAASSRNRLFLTYAADGQARLNFATTAQTRKRFAFANGAAPQLAIFAPRADGLVSVNPNGTIQSWSLHDPHPEASVRALFAPVHYEGFPDATYAYQSTGATDETEPKISLVPLIFGSLKGTLYAMLFSTPIAVFAALYTSVFMNRRLRAVVKPVMELMATIPSVVLGLLAGLWLAPRLQQTMPIALFSFIFLAGTVLLVGGTRRFLPNRAKQILRPGTEVIYLIPVLLVALVIVLSANGMVDGLFPGGFFEWIYRHFDIRYDQRNAVVVGIAMGLAVIPIIFSVSEDALSSVPRHLTAGSLALGATPWQTAWRVVLPAASPGIFSALMIGFGRAVGETMIMLMATGNTPIMDWSLFNGFRTLSANIATEIPEAPQGATLYRVLFLSALLLFAFTLLINTTAEIVRSRLRQRYSRF